MTSTPSEHSAWTAPGANAAAEATYASVKTALKDIITNRSVEVFLQGSYANSTNIRADSDVDIVVMTRRTFRGATARLSATGRVKYDALPASTYQVSDLRQEVHAALKAYYGSPRVHPKDKCIRVDASSGYVDADVVPCIQYRWYRTSGSDLGDPWEEGIAICPNSGGTVINFPKQHIARGQAKNGLCNDQYKPTVRQLKRLRNRATDEHRLPDDIAPGYLLECMASNIPNSDFVYNDSDRLQNAVLWLKYADKADFHSSDGIHYLFHDDPGHYDVATAQRIVDALWEAY